MKFVIGILLAGIGYAAFYAVFDPTVRSVVMSQPTYMIIFEYICAHITIAAFVGMEFYAGMTAKMPEKDWDDCGPVAFALGVLWPVSLPGYYIGRYVVCKSIVALDRHMTAWMAKRREARKKMS